MKSSLFLILGLLGGLSFADTPPPPIPNPLNVLVTNPSPIPVTGSFPLTIPYSGPTATPAPTQAAFVGGVDPSGNLQGLKLNSSKALTVDGSGVTQPVSGTFWQSVQPVSQSGSWTNMCTQPTGADLHVDVDSLPAVSGTVAITASSPIPVSGAFPTPPPTQNVVITSSTPIPVTGTFWQTTQPVSGAFPTPPPTQNVAITSSTPLPVTGTFYQATQPVSGTITANQGTPGSSPWPVNIENSVTVTGAFPTPPPTQNVAITSSTPLPVTGTFYQATQPVSASSPLPVNLNQVGGSSFALGQTTAANSIPVTFANNSGVGSSYSTFTFTATSQNFTINTAGWSGISLNILPSATQPVFFRVSYDGSTYTASSNFCMFDQLINDGNCYTTTGDDDAAGSNTTFTGNIGGIRSFQVYSAGSFTGTVVVNATLTTYPLAITGSAATFFVNQLGVWNMQLQDGTGSPVDKGQSTMSGSLPVTIASNQSSIPVTVPSPVAVTQSGNWNLQYNTANSNGTLSSRQTVTGTETNLAAPANAVGVIVECESVNADNLRWGFSSSTSAILSTTLGMLCEPGRDSGYLTFGAGTYLHMISTGSGSDYIDVQWVLTH